jgi:hypothetical protein
MASLVSVSNEHDNHVFQNNNTTPSPGLPDGLFSNQNPNLGKFWWALYWKMFKYFMAIWNTLWRFGIFYDHKEHFVFIWYFFGLGIMYQ